MRFSTPEQAQGDSERRQTEKATAYCARRGWTLDPELTFRDLGYRRSAARTHWWATWGPFSERSNRAKSLPALLSKPRAIRIRKLHALLPLAAVQQLLATVPLEADLDIIAVWDAAKNRTPVVVYRAG